MSDAKQGNSIEYLYKEYTRLSDKLGALSQSSFEDLADVSPDGVTNNDTDDSDTGANNLQNFPEITSAIRFSTGVTLISGTLNSNPNRNFTVQCFLADGDPSNHGEGQSFLAQETDVQTDASGDASFTCTATGLVVRQKVSATARNITNSDTSEFSENETVIAGP